MRVKHTPYYSVLTKGSEIDFSGVEIMPDEEEMLVEKSKGCRMCDFIRFLFDYVKSKYYGY
jgi:hypothetical protein